MERINAIIRVVGVALVGAGATIIYWPAGLVAVGALLIIGTLGGRK